jgi:hypothetical protein
MSQPEGIPAPPEWAARAHIDDAGYDAACERAKSDPEGYWRDIAGRLDWIEKPTQIKDVSFDAADLRIRWYADGVLNASVECPPGPMGADHPRWASRSNRPSQITCVEPVGLRVRLTERVLCLKKRARPSRPIISANARRK